MHSGIQIEYVGYVSSQYIYEMISKKNKNTDRSI